MNVVRISVLTLMGSVWTSEATFEDDDKASGVATKIT